MQRGMVWLFFCLLTQQAFAQLIEVPIRRFEDYPASHNAPHKLTASARITALTPLSLPFFDDFSRPSQLRMGSQPDTARWMAGGGANINNNLPINHPTMYVATMDGLKGNGAPYDFTSPLAQGSTDTLTSRPIDLSPYLPTNSLYMSFYWEARGMAEQPDLSDSLVLQFKDSVGVGNWQTMWTQTGQVINNTGAIVNVSNTKFDSVFVALEAGKFFHKTFQFRFLAYGRRAGAFDVWHLDYIYLDKDRKREAPYPGQSILSTTPPDVAMQGAVSSFLKRYTSMPVWQYFVKPAQEMADSIYTKANNLKTTPTRGSFKIRQLEDTVSKQVFQSCDLLPPNSIDSCKISQPFLEQRSTFVKLKPALLPVPAVKKRMVLKTTFSSIITAEDLRGLQEEIRYNNEISGYTVLDNYYSYDDGTAESAAGINQRTGGVAVRYIVNRPDTLLAVRLYFAQYNTNQKGQSFVLQIFDNKNGLPNKVLYQRSDTITYTDTLNKFAEYKLYQVLESKIVLDAVTVRDTFYVGWQQTTETILPVGLDKNIDSRNTIFINLGANIQGERDWIPNTDQAIPISGSFMIRPVMGSRPPVVTAIEEEVPGIPPFEVSPNPTDGKLTWNDARVSSVQVYDLAGKLLQRQVLKNQPTPLLDLGFLPNGLYLLHFSDGKHTWVRKVVMAR